MKVLHIIKIGGAVINDQEMLTNCLDDLAALQMPYILVHGGGRDVDLWLEKIGHKIQKHEGRRITDDLTLELAVMSYAGWVNKKIVSGLQARGKNCLGLTGADLDCIRAIKRPSGEIDYGWVGDVKYLKARVFAMLLKEEITPVCCAITHDGKGNLLNTNADTIASLLAAELSSLFATTLWYAFEKPGVLNDVDDPSSLVAQIDQATYQEMVANGKIHSGMQPKLTNAFAALKGGAESVHIFSVTDINQIPEVTGTKITL